MKLSLSKHFNSKITKAITEFDLIEDGDKILVGLSGGKDSAFLLYALVVLNKFLNIDYELEAFTVDPGFKANDYLTSLKKYCESLEVPLTIKKTEIASFILNEDIENPCSMCAHFRKGAMVKFMKKQGFKKMAYGHHYDDAVETFLMSIFYSGQLKTFQPKQYLSNNSVYIIRPLVYLREKEIREGNKFITYQAYESPCPYDKNSKREEIKKRFKDYFYDKQIFYNMVAAMREGTTIDLWPEKMDEKKLGDKMHQLWY